MDALARLEEVVGAGSIRRDAEALDEVARDQTENPPCAPAAVVSIPSLEALRAVVALANDARVPITPRVAGTNLGGLAIPAAGGWVLDLSGMNRILEINRDDMVAVIEPGVSFGQLKDAMEGAHPQLTVGFPLSPPETSVMANCLLDGLGNRSLLHGAMGEWISGLEVVRADGSTLRTGAGALGVPVPFGRAPLPDLSGLFISWQGVTGIVSKLAIQLWPLPAYRERMFVLTYDRTATMRAMRELPAMGVVDDLGGLSWPTGKMLFGVERPCARDPNEPEFFLYLDVGAPSAALLRAKRRALDDYIASLRRGGLRVDPPIDVPTLVAIEPKLAKLAEFPTRLDFLLDHPDGGLTWVGTYGPMSRLARATQQGIAIVERHGFPPMIVARPMKGGHFAVLRFIEVFRRDDPDDVARVRACNEQLCDALLAHGFIMYKTPGWAVERYRARLDPGFARLVGEVRALMDPHAILNPDRWRL